MTEAEEWLTSENPIIMLLLVKHRRTMRKYVKQRKQRLFAVACCRRLWPLIDNERLRQGVEAVERFADGQATSEELQAAEKEVNAIWKQNAADDVAFACNQLFWDEVDGIHVSTSAISAAFKWQQTQTGRSFEPFDGRRSGAAPAEERAQCDLLRDIFGNPFSPFPFAPVWRSETAVALASGIYAERAFDRLPILADALEEAGCDYPDILDHCRGDGPHVRGCWVVDLMLGKG